MTPTEMTKILLDNILDQMDAVLLEGLRQKGYEFKDVLESMDFIKKHCRCEDCLESKRRVYFVKDTPFLLHNYGVDVNLPRFDDKDPFEISVNYGTYAYL